MGERRVIDELIKEIEETMEAVDKEDNAEMKELHLGKAYRRAIDLESNIYRLLHEAEKESKEKRYGGDKR